VYKTWVGERPTINTYKMKEEEEEVKKKVSIMEE